MSGMTNGVMDLQVGDTVELQADVGDEERRKKGGLAAAMSSHAAGTVCGVLEVAPSKDFGLDSPKFGPCARVVTRQALVNYGDVQGNWVELRHLRLLERGGARSWGIGTPHNGGAAGCFD